MGYIENILIWDHIFELEDAGLDVDELAGMDWASRYDAIEAAGLYPMDYDYGFIDHYDDPEPVKKVKRVSKPVKNTTFSYATTKKPVESTPRKLSRREKKEIRKRMNKAISELATDMLWFMMDYIDI